MDVAGLATYGALRTMLRTVPEREEHLAACVLNAPDGERGDSDRCVVSATYIFG
jgi:hypothetical protein